MRLGDLVSLPCCTIINHCIPVQPIIVEPRKFTYLYNGISSHSIAELSISEIPEFNENTSNEWI